MHGGSGASAVLSGRTACVSTSLLSVLSTYVAQESRGANNPILINS
jgi:hypothetical protein